ncbi:MAG: trypsin-like peptidase domain-containing protein [Hyphomicrobiales bacterium]|nr:trypsin-like peptidase domain-containing protein [Hyphomicrobiales bacterium]
MSWNLTRLVICAAAIAVLVVANTDTSRAGEEEAKQLIVLIEGKIANQDVFGAGIIIGSRADRLYIATAHHVAWRHTKLEDVRLRLKQLPGEYVRAEVLDDYDVDLDLAVIVVKGITHSAIPVNEIPFQQLDASGGLARGDEVFTIGNPIGEGWRINVTPDRISDSLGDFLRFESLSIQNGHSGGGLFTKKWELVGMITRDQPPRAQAVKIDRVLEQLRRWGYPVDLVQQTPAVQSPPPDTSESHEDRRAMTEANAAPIISLTKNSWLQLDSIYSDPRFSDPGTACIEELTWIADRGLRGLYCHIKSSINYRKISELFDVPIFDSGPHTSSTLNLNAEFEFGHYNIEFVKSASRIFSIILEDRIFIEETKELYNTYIRRLARTYYLTYSYLKQDEDSFERERRKYLSLVKSRKLPPNYAVTSHYIHQFNIIKGMNEPEYDVYEVPVSVLFWIRRSIDGTAGTFYNMVNSLLLAYDAEFVNEHRFYRR